MTLTLAPAPTATPVAVRPRTSPSAAEIADLDARLSRQSATAIVRWAVDRFGRRLVLTSSFADTVLVDIAHRVDPDIEVVFLDTGFHFAETLDTVRRAMQRYALDLTVLRPPRDAADVWAHGTEACCRDRKVTALDHHLLTTADAWMSGLRRADGPSRADTPIVSLDRRGLVKVNPLARWSDAEVADYIEANDIIVNPLGDEGYDSIGCWPCTEPSEGRAGRWTGTEKTECGLHGGNR